MKPTSTILLLLTLAGLHLHAQEDTLLFQLTSEWEYTPFYTAYSGTFDAQNPDYLHVASNDLGLVTFHISADGQLNAVDTIPMAALHDRKVSNVYQQEQYLYVALGSFQSTGNNPGLAILDVSQPEQKEIVAIWDTTAYLHGCAIVKVVDDFAYLGLMEDGLLILDVSDKSQPQFVSQLMLEEDFPVPPGVFSVPHSRGLEVVGDYAFVCQDAGGFRVVDISDKSAPVEVAQYVSEYIQNNAARAYNNVAISGQYAYIGVDYCGVEVVDISDPLQPQHVSHYNPWDCSPTNWADGQGHVNEVFVDEEQQVLFASAGDSELLALDIANPQQLELLGSFGQALDSVATWGLALQDDRVALFQIDNSPVPDWIPQPFYSDFGGVRLLNWERIDTDVEEINGMPDIRLWPNPATSHIYFEIPASYLGSTKVEIFDLQGRLLHSQKITSDQATLQLKEWPSGMYVYRILEPTRKHLQSGKIIKN